MRYKRKITRIEFKDLLNGDFSNISNFNDVDKMYMGDQFYKLLTVTKGRKVIVKMIVAWGYDGWDNNRYSHLKEILLADYVHDLKYSPYDYKEMCI